MDILNLLNYISLSIGIAGISIIFWGALITSLRVIRLEINVLKGRTIFKEREALRHQLGSYLLLGLEFMIAADIIHTIMRPTLNDIALLGGIVAIRTVISYFLDREMAEFYHHEGKKGKGN